MPTNRSRASKPRPIVRAAIEIAFIVFLFYSNLLMGEFTRSSGRHKTLAFALEDIVTRANFMISFLTAVVGYVVFEMLRRKV